MKRSFSKKELFLDTTIQISRFIREQEFKEKIKMQLSNFEQIVTSLIVLLEFKRRLLGEAIYLLNLLNDKQSYQKVRRHIENILQPQQRRKKQICLNILSTVFEEASDSELTERAKQYLRMLIKHGVYRFKKSINILIENSGCECAKMPIIEKEPYKRYELNVSMCRKLIQQNKGCPLENFIRRNLEILRELLNYLQTFPPNEKSEEIERSERFIQDVINNPGDIIKERPCYTVGDLLIALESKEIENFYTMNWSESKFFCDFFNQNLILRPNNPNNEDEIFPRELKPWRR